MLSGFDFEAWTASDTATVNTAVTPTNVISPPVSRGPTIREGDWTCNACGNVNFAKRTRCNKCGVVKPKPENENWNDPLEEVPHYGGPPGLFKKGDWPCTHCGNVNWARRGKCNVCNAPKPSLTEAPRTGRGGGHYDLQDPHDRQQHQSDDEEYDEFGRKKKKKKAPSELQQCINTAILNSNAKLSVEEPSLDTVRLHFPPPPLCYLKGRSMSMSSRSSRSSDYVEDEEQE